MKTPEIIFTDGTNTGTITCKKCGRTKIVDVSHFKKVRKQMKVKCTCGALFEVLFESRKYHRRKVHLQGNLLDPKSHSQIDDITIIDISAGGISFLTNLQTIKSDEIYTISFYLDDDDRSHVEEDVIIKHIKNQEVGCAFAEYEKYNYNLDFYLMPFSIVD